MGRLEDIKKEEISIINKFIRRKRLSKVLQARIINYLEYLYIGHSSVVDS